MPRPAQSNDGFFLSDVDLTSSTIKQIPHTNYLAKVNPMHNCQELYQQANQLPPLEKLRLAELLLADLDTPNPRCDAIWRVEAQNRWQAYKAGELKTVSYDAVMHKYK